MPGAYLKPGTVYSCIEFANGRSVRLCGIVDAPSLQHRVLMLDGNNTVPTSNCRKRDDITIARITARSDMAEDFGAKAEAPKRFDLSAMNNPHISAN